MPSRVQTTVAAEYRSSAALSSIFAPGPYSGIEAIHVPVVASPRAPPSRSLIAE